MSQPAAAREAWLHIVQLFTSDETSRNFVAAAGDVGLTAAALRALLALGPGVRGVPGRHSEAKPMRALAQDWHCDPSMVTGIVDQLEQQGYAERRPHATDRRVKTVSLTPAGSAARARAMTVLSVPPPGITSLPATEQRELRDLLRKATAALPPLR